MSMVAKNISPIRRESIQEVKIPNAPKLMNKKSPRIFRVEKIVFLIRMYFVFRRAVKIASVRVL